MSEVLGAIILGSELRQRLRAARRSAWCSRTAPRASSTWRSARSRSSPPRSTTTRTSRIAGRCSLALLFSVGIVAPLRRRRPRSRLFRFLRTASETAKLVSVLGLFVALPQIDLLVVRPEHRSPTRSASCPTAAITYSPLHNVFVSRDDLAIIIVTGRRVFVGSTLMLRYTALGLRMRAVVESPRLTELAGVDADRVSMTSWMLSSLLAGLAGVLLTPVFAGQVGYPALRGAGDRGDRGGGARRSREHPARVRGRARCSASCNSSSTSTSRPTTSWPARCARRCRSSCCSRVLMLLAGRSARRRRGLRPAGGRRPAAAGTRGTPTGATA